jgi:hypothetical protein
MVSGFGKSAGFYLFRAYAGNPQGGGSAGFSRKFKY